MSHADQAAFEALTKLKYEIRGRHAQGSWAQEYTIRPEAARAMLAAVSAGQVPTIYHISQIPGVREYATRYDQDQQVIAALRADVERLKKGTAEAADTVLSGMRAVLHLRAEVEREKARADEMKADGERAVLEERNQTAKATAQRDLMAGLLIETVAVIQAIRSENPGQRWSYTLERRMLAALDSVTHAQMFVRQGER